MRVFRESGFFVVKQGLLGATAAGCVLLGFFAGCQTGYAPASGADKMLEEAASQDKQLMEPTQLNRDPFEQVTQTSSKSSQPPYGVFDIQGRHGHGQWKESPDKLVR